MLKVFAIADGLVGQARTQHGATAFEDPKTTGYVMQQLIAAAELLWGGSHAEVMQGDPTCDHHGGRQDQLEGFPLRIKRGIVAV